jgi:hypothetical protein
VLLFYSPYIHQRLLPFFWVFMSFMFCFYNLVQHPNPQIPHTVIPNQFTLSVTPNLYPPSQKISLWFAVCQIVP